METEDYDDDKLNHSKEQDETFALLQDYMLKKGIIQEDMQGKELNEFLRSEIQSTSGESNSLRIISLNCGFIRFISLK